MSGNTRSTVEISIYSGYTIGIHSLMAVVIKDGIPYSKELIFRVKYKGES